MNSPVNFNDPTGHVPSCDPDDIQCQQKQKSKTGNQNADYIKRGLMKKYNIKFDGDWASSELGIVSEALRKMAAYVGGEKNLNTAFTLAAQSWDKNATAITLLRVSTYSINPNTTDSNGPSAAGWCNCAGATISFGGAVFDSDYHKGSNRTERPYGPAYQRPSSLKQYELSAKSQ